MRALSLKLALLELLFVGMVAVGMTSSAVALPLKLVPQTGLQLHLDGENPANTASTWIDRSTSGNNGTVSGATFNAGVGYSFDGTDDFVSIANNTAHTSAKFAYAVSLSASSTQAALTSGQRYFFGDTGASWNDLYYDYGNNAVTWDTYNSVVAAGNNLFRSAPKQVARNFTGEHLIGVTFEAVNPTDTTGTARLYVDGVFVAEATGARKPEYTTNHARINRIGNSASSYWQGDINEVLIYGDYLGTPDELMSTLFVGLPQPVVLPAPEPSTGLLFALGLTGWGVARRGRQKPRV